MVRTRTDEGKLSLVPILVSASLILAIALSVISIVPARTSVFPVQNVYTTTYVITYNSLSTGNGTTVTFGRILSSTSTVTEATTKKTTPSVTFQSVTTTATPEFASWPSLVFALVIVATGLYLASKRTKDA